MAINAAPPRSGIKEPGGVAPGAGGPGFDGWTDLVLFRLVHPASHPLQGNRSVIAAPGPTLLRCRDAALPPVPVVSW